MSQQHRRLRGGRGGEGGRGGDEPSLDLPPHDIEGGGGRTCDLATLKSHLVL